MRKIIRYFTVLAAIPFFTACNENEGVSKLNNETAEITHHYEMNEQTFTVIYEMDNEYKILSEKGDINSLVNFKETLNNEEGGLLQISQITEDGKEIHIKYISPSQREDKNTHERTMECTDWYSPNGTASFFFYRDINFSNELVDLRQVNTSYFQDQWLDGANDQISSFQLGANSELRIFEDSCFYGREIAFRSSITNLHWVLTGFLANGQPVVEDFNDWISSLKGWSY